MIGAGLSLGFWLYGVGRTMCETEYFDASACLAGIVVGVIFPISITGPFYLGKRILFDNKILPITPLLIAFAASLFVAGLVSEALILRDEGKFFSEVSKANGLYSRARAWPNGLCSLVYVPDRGIHSTD